MRWKNVFTYLSGYLGYAFQKKNLLGKNPDGFFPIGVITTATIEHIMVKSGGGGLSPSQTWHKY